MADKPYVYQLSPMHPTLQEQIKEHFHMVQKDELDSMRDKISAIFVFVSPAVDKELIASLPNLKVVGNCAVGYNHVDLEACRCHGVRVGYTPDVLNDATADLGMALLLSTARRIVEGDQLARHPDLKALPDDFFGLQVSNMTLGIIGMGRIGIEVAKRAKGFEMKLIYHNRSKCPQEVEESLGAKYMESLDELLRESDHVILVAPATPSTYHMMSTKQFSLMKKTSTFINISRGSLLDQDALLHALKNEVIAAAGLDVTNPEPLPRDHALLQLPNLLLSPHVGSATLQTRRAMMEMTIKNIKGALSGGEMVNEVTLPLPN